MKKILSVLLSIAMLVTILPATMGFAAFTGEATVLEVEVLDSTTDTGIVSGDTVTVNVKYKSGFAHVSSIDATVGFDPQYFTPVSGSVTANTRFTTDNSFQETYANYAISSGDAIELTADEILMSAQFTVNEGVVANTEAVFDLGITNYGCAHDGIFDELDDDYEYDIAPVDVVAKDATVTINPASTPEPEPEEPATETVTFGLTDEFKALLTDSGVAKFSKLELRDDAEITKTENRFIISWDEDGYNKARLYNVVYTPAGGEETTASKIKYSEMRAIIDDENNTVSTVAACTGVTEFNYEASSVELNSGASFFNDAHNFGITGSAWDDAYHVYTTREYAPGRAKTASNFADGLVPNGNADSAFAKHMVAGGYTYTITPDKDATIYLLFNAMTDNTKAVLEGDGWEDISYPANIAVPEEGKIKQLNASTASWWTIDAAYDYEQYPYILTKMQYDTGSATNVFTYFNIWKIQVQRGETVKIPGIALGVGDQNASKCMVKFSEHLSDDVSATLKVGSQTVELTERFDDSIELTGVSKGDVISAATKNGAKVKLDKTTVDTVPATVTATITSEYGNSVTYSIRLLPKQPVISEVNYASNAFGGYYPVQNATWSRGTNSDVSAAISPDDFAAIEAKYGKFTSSDPFYAGTDAYAYYPSAGASAAVSGYKYIDSPSQIRLSSVSRMFFDKGAYVFKHNKTRVNNSDYYYGGVGKYDGTNDNYYLTFKIDAPGTMYLADVEGKGLPNATNMGYKAVSGLKFVNNTKLYAMHFEAGQTVKVPSYGWDTSWGLDTTARTWYNPSYMVFVFDSERDTTVESIAIGGESVGSIMINDAIVDYDATIVAKEGDVIELDVKTTDADAVVEPSVIRATVEDGKAFATFTVYSSDLIAKMDYTVSLSLAEEKMIVNGSTGEGNNIYWINGMYTDNATDAVNGGGYSAVNDMVVGTTAKYIDRTNKTVGSSKLNGATYIRTPKNQSSGNYTAITVDENSGYFKTGEDEEWISITDASNGNGNNATTLRKVTKSSYSLPQFATNVEDWITFAVTSDCTVVIGDDIRRGYPNLDKELWLNNTAYALNNGGTEHTYVRHFKAGETVSLPSYGMPEGIDQIRYYKYTVDGVEHTYETQIKDDYLNWDNITVAVVWDEENADASISYINIDGEKADATRDGNAYTIEAPSGAESVALEVVASDPYATVKAPETIAIGETVDVKVTAVNGTEELYTITLVGETRQLSVTVIDGTATLATGGAASNIDALYTGAVAFGGKITLTAIPDSGATFMYWKEENTDRIVSTNAVLNVTVASDASYVAVCASAESGHMVTFVNSNNAIVAQGYVSEDYKVPANPYYLGYIFGGWATEEGLDAKLNAGDSLPEITKDTTYRAFYTKDDKKYFLIVKPDAEVSGYEYTLAYNEKFTTTAEEKSPDGTKVFSHWLKNGKIVSYNREYSFYMPNYDVELITVYADVAPDTSATVVMATPVLVDANRISFFMERNVTDGCTVLESGILLSSTSDEITLDSYELKATAQQTTAPGQYTVRKANVEVGDTWNAVGYLIYKDAEGAIHTIYSNAVSYTVE